MFGSFAASALLKLLPWGLLAVVLLGAGVWIKLLHADNANLSLKYEQAQANFQEAVGVNKENQKTITQLRLDRIADREATLKEQDRVTQLTGALERAKKDMKNAPNANAPAGEYFDALSRSLPRIDTSSPGHEDGN